MADNKSYLCPECRRSYVRRYIKRHMVRQHDAWPLPNGNIVRNDGTEMGLK